MMSSWPHHIDGITDCSVDVPSGDEYLPASMRTWNGVMEAMYASMVGVAWEVSVPEAGSADSCDGEQGSAWNHRTSGIAAPNIPSEVRSPSKWT
jgi:hypothetical protein